MENKKQQIENIKRMQKEKDVVILAHYYVDGAVQEIADFVGDSFFLAKKAVSIPNQNILFCGVSFMGESAKILKVKGRFYMVHRPFRLPEIMTKMCAYGIEPKRMRLVYPYIDKEPNMVLIEGMKGGNPRMQVEPPLVVYQKDGSYTEELLALYGMSPS